MGLPYRTTRKCKQWMSRDPIRPLQELAAGEGARLGGRARRRSTAKTQAAVDASIEFARKSADPDPKAGVLNTYANRRGRGDPVLQPKRASRRAADDVETERCHGRRNRTTTRSSKPSRRRCARTPTWSSSTSTRRRRRRCRPAKCWISRRSSATAAPRAAAGRSTSSGSSASRSAPPPPARRRSRASRRWRRSTPSSTSRTRPARSAR